MMFNRHKMLDVQYRISDVQSRISDVRDPIFLGSDRPIKSEFAYCEIIHLRSPSSGSQECGRSADTRESHDRLLVNTTRGMLLIVSFSSDSVR